MKTKLITALRACLVALENGTFTYNWKMASSCNCGVVAAAISGQSIAQLADWNLTLKHPVREDGQPDNTWRGIVGMNCPVTGVPQDKILADLMAAGLTAQDLVHLEHLDDPRVLAKAPAVFDKGAPGTPAVAGSLFGFKKAIPAIPATPPKPRKLKYDSKADLIRYLRAWVEVLEEDGRQDSPPVSDVDFVQAEV